MATTLSFAEHHARKARQADELAARTELLAMRKATSIKLAMPRLRSGEAVFIENITSFRACARMGR